MARVSSVLRMKKDKPVFGGQAISASEALTEGFETHVLAVDDCLIDRRVIERLLKTDSFKVTTVDSATRALEILGVGYDLLKKVKEIKSLKEIPVVIMSSENVPQRIQRCLAEGAEDFIIKPVQLADIKRLRGHIKLPKPVPTLCTKRKVSSGRLAGETSERRPRISGVTVA